MSVAPAHPSTSPSPRPRPAHRPTGRPDLRVVRPDEVAADARRRRKAVLGTVGVGIVCAALFGVVGFHVKLTEGQLDLDRTQERLNAEKARHSRLRLEVAQLESPQRVVAVAQQRLGMVPPPGVTYLSPSGATNGIHPVAPPAASSPPPPPSAATPATTPGAPARGAPPATTVSSGR